MRRRYIALPAAACAALALTAMSGAPGLVDPDGFSHLAYARMLWRSGFALRGHPFLPYTILGQTGVDPWWGFHFLLIPFLPLGDLWGARIAAAAIAATAGGTLAWAISRVAPKAPWWLALAPFAAGTFMIRSTGARPGHLSTAVLLVELVGGLGLVHPAVPAAAVFALGLSHLSAPAVVAFAVIGWLFGERGSFRAVLWSIGALALALVVRPDRADLPMLGLQQVALVFGGGLPHPSAEVSEKGVWWFAREIAPLLALVTVAAAASRRRASHQLAVGLAAALTCAMMVGALRFVDYAAPVLALFAATLWPARPARWLPASCALAFALFLPTNLLRVWDVGRRFYDEPAAFERIARDVRATVPPGSIIFTDDAWVTQILLSSLPEYRYLVAYDPVFLYMGSPERFWRWHHAVSGGIDCAAPKCPGARRSGPAIASAIASFDTRYAITSMPRGRGSTQDLMAADARDFDLLDLAPGQAFGLYFWKLRNPR